MGSIPGFVQWVNNLISCDVGQRCGLDLVLLWLWCRPVAVALIQLLAQELPYATDVAMKKKKKASFWDGNIFTLLSLLGFDLCP